jgi:prepilin-type processing-associated H-X9-DG protein
MVKRPARSALTLVELIVVIAIIGVLIGLMIPAVMRVRETANASRCRNNMREIGVALANYMSEHGSLPPGSENTNDTWGAPGTTWSVRILPFFDHEDIYRKIDFKAKDPAGQVFANTVNSVGGDPVTASNVEGFLCPSDGLGGQLSVTPSGTYSHSNYLGFFGTYPYGSEHSNGAFGVNFGARSADFMDGMSNTVVVGEYLTGVPQGEAEKDIRGVFWLDRPGSSQIHSMTVPNADSKDPIGGGTCVDRPDMNLPCSDVLNTMVASAGTRSRHRDGVNALFGDGSVRFINNSIDRMTWQALGTAAGGEVASEDGKYRAGGGTGKRGAPPASSIRDHYLVQMKSGSAASLQALGATIKQEYKAINSALIYVPKGSINRVKSYPGIKYIGNDRFMQICAQTVPTGIRRIKANQSRAWPGPVNVDVAIIDTGIDLNHRDVNVVANIGFGYPSGMDDQGHGTHCSGIVGAIDNTIDVVGVAPGVRLHAVKVLSSSGSGATSDVVSGVMYVGGQAGTIKVANMSLGANVGANDPVMDAAVKFASDQGCIIVAAAGNSSEDASNFSPANSPDAVCVAAMCDTDGKPGGRGPAGSFGDRDDTFVASFSNFGAKVDVIAPGEDILSLKLGGGTIVESGTSMAAPHVTGLIALMVLNNSNPITPPAPIVPSSGFRNVIIAPITPPPPPTPPSPPGGRGSGPGGSLTVDQVRFLLKATAREQIQGLAPGPTTMSYPLIDAEDY